MLAIFDLDNTLIGGDSDSLWGEFLVEKKVVDGEFYGAENQRFYDEYKAGTLDIFEFLRFSLKPIADNDLDKMLELRKIFIQERIQKIMLPKAKVLLDSHRELGHTLLIITATNHFVTQPIADLFGVEHLLATNPEIVNGKYTGNVDGTPCFREGKVTRLAAWIEERHETLDGSWFYSDSHNDLPLLKKVTTPVAVDADEKLAEYAQENGWKTLSLR